MILLVLLIINNYLPNMGSFNQYNMFFNICFIDFTLE